MVLATLAACASDLGALRVDRLDLGGRPDQVFFASVDALVARVGEDMVRVDLAGGAPEPLAAGVRWIAPVAGGAWLVLDVDGRVWVRLPDGTASERFTDERAQRVVGTLDAVGFEVEPYGDLLVRRVGDEEPVALMDGAYPLDGAPLAMLADGSEVLAADAADPGRVWRADAVTGAVIAGQDLVGTLVEARADDGFHLLQVGPDAIALDDDEVRPSGPYANAGGLVDRDTALVLELAPAAGDLRLVRYDAGGSEVLAQGPAEQAKGGPSAASPDGAALAVATAAGVRVFRVTSGGG